MGQCACNPEIETRFLCMKHDRYLCEECLKCQDPELYCKFRSSCPIWFLEKKGGKELLDADNAAAEERQTREVSLLPNPILPKSQPEGNSAPMPCLWPN
jgi:hypothetical protein